jgi:hypothetical protein
MDTFKTPGGKIIELFHEGYLLKIRFTSGGQLPDVLKGSYTSFVQAKTSIEMYLDTLKNKSKEKS